MADGGSSGRIEFYSMRRVNPYLGMIQVIDAGSVRAFSNGTTAWRTRRVYDPERFWFDEELERVADNGPINRHDFQRVLRQHPALPFPQGDYLELWLLRKSTGMPLALLKTCRLERDMEELTDTVWRPFLPGEQGFSRRAAASPAHPHFGDQERIQTLVNYAARPEPAAQWFRRHSDGGGTGLGGARVDAALEGRTLSKGDFPELLVDECWDRERDERLVRAFHEWNASRLLVHQGLAPDTRARLEQAVSREPAGLLEYYPVIPEILDTEQMKVAVVTARLMQSG